MKKRLRLKKEIKEGLVMLATLLVLVFVATCFLKMFEVRMEKIESGQMVLVDHNEGDR